MTNKQNFRPEVKAVDFCQGGESFLVHQQLIGEAAILAWTDQAERDP